MTLDILKAMIKEEWRLHTSLIGVRLFAFFPLLILFICLIASFFLPYFRSIITTSQMFLYAHYLFILFGLSIGAFGLFGKEVMNRRFGQASLIAYSSRTFPLSERRLFLNFFIKDIIYYLFLWLIPITLGFIIATPFIGINPVSAIFACGTLFLSFLLGLSIVFFLSTLYAHSSKFLILLLVIVGIVVLIFSKNLPFDIKTLVIPYSIFYQITFKKILLITLLITIPAALSFIFIKVDYPERKKQYKNSLIAISNKLRFTVLGHYVAKDFLDLKRSEGGVGKIIFQFLFPVGLTWMFLSIFSELIPSVKAIMIFSIFIGIVSSSIYNMLTAFDSFNSYMFLPVTVSTIIKSKLISFLIFNIISFVILIIVSISVNQIFYFLPALFSFITISFYSLAMTVYFAGLHPSTFLYNLKIFSQYIVAVGPLLFIFTIASIINPFFMLISPVLILPSLYILKKSYKKWDNWQPIGF